jgi:hypothetical protein
MSSDYGAPAELFLVERTKSGRRNYLRFTTAPEAIRYAVETLHFLTRLIVSARAPLKTTGPSGAQISEFGPPPPTFKLSLKGSGSGLTTT